MTISKQDIPRCATCLHWDKTDETGWCSNLGETSKVDIHLSSYDLSAQISYIETAEDFSCINHSELKEE